jgi:hypothetical protein
MSYYVTSTSNAARPAADLINRRLGDAGDASDLRAVEREIAECAECIRGDLVIEQERDYTWRTDAASGVIKALNEQDALWRVCAAGEWAQPDSSREQEDIADGAWLTVFDADGVPVARRGTMS